MMVGLRASMLGNLWGGKAIPHTIIIELTSRCNLRCKMCSIWKEQPKTDLSMGEFCSLISDSSLRQLKCIALTGGEPLLLPDLAGYCSEVQRILPKASINISSNGFETGLLLDMLGSIDTRRVTLTLSYDGKHTHDMVRGVKGSRARLLKTIRSLQEEYPKIPLTVKYTITKINSDDIVPTALECKSLGYLLQIKYAVDCPNYYNRTEMNAFSPADNPGIRHSLQKALDIGAIANVSAVRSMIEGGRRKCEWRSDVLFISNSGDVHLCQMRPSIGSIGSAAIGKILKSEVYRKRLLEMEHCPNLPCIHYSV